MICVTSPSKGSTLRQSLVCQYQCQAHSPDVTKDEDEVRQAVERCASSGESTLALSHFANLRSLPAEQLQACSPNLYALSITNCYNLNRVPEDCLCHFHRLEALDLSYNCLTAFPKEICQLKALQRLVLSNNHLQAVAEDIDALAGTLREVVLDNNFLASFPPAILRLRRLELLSVYNNPLITEEGTSEEAAALTTTTTTTATTVVTTTPAQQRGVVARNLAEEPEEGVIREEDIPEEFLQPKKAEDYCSICLAGAGAASGSLVRVFVFVDVAGNKSLPLHYTVCSAQCQKAVAERAESESVNLSLLQY